MEDASSLHRYGLTTGDAMDYFIIEGNLLYGNVSGGMYDGASGTHKSITNNLP